MLVDANLLLYAVHDGAEQHTQAASWMTEKLNGAVRVGLPWQSLSAFLRISTHARVFDHPLDPKTAWGCVEAWLSAPAAWVPEPGPAYPRVLGDLIRHHGIRGNLVPDAALAALAIEHGVTLASTDEDFARFDELTWINPLR